MAIGVAADMGNAPDSTPLMDPRVFDSAEFHRNPYPYYRIMRDHYPVFYDRLQNCYDVTRYGDITECYFGEVGFNKIPKCSSRGAGHYPTRAESHRTPTAPQSLPTASRRGCTHQTTSID
ncbi:MAG: hypothetical protein ACKVIQ_08915 [Acidimicrobiales bacterium]|jgi:hypothetical protein